MNVQNAEGVLIGKRSLEGLLQLAFGVNLKPQPCAEQFWHLVVLPVVNVVKRAFLNESLCGIALVIQHHDNRIEFLPNRRGQFHAGHLKSPVTDQDQWSELSIGDLHANTGGNREAHGCVVGGAQKFGVLSDRKIGSREERISRVGHHNDVLIQS